MTESKQKKVLIAGATGYLGRYLVQEYLARDGGKWHVTALVRKRQTDLPAGVHQVVAQATDLDSLRQQQQDPKQSSCSTSIMQGVDLVVSALGITRQRDGLTYRDVDYQANKNLLQLALEHNVPQFAYIHVLHGDRMSELGVPGVVAKEDFVKELEAASSIRSTVICPSGFFSDMKDFLDMAQSGRAYLFGDGKHTINPIHGADLAKAAADAIDSGRKRLNVGGPDTFTHQQLAELAFECLGKKEETKISHFPDWTRRFMIWIVPWVTPSHISGPVQFFLTAFGFDMVGEPCGDHHLKDFFMEMTKASE